MQLIGRGFGAGNGYRYGFNGKELDQEVVQYDYGFRIYDPRLVKFKSVDPLTKSYPWYTPYQFAGNKPIWCDDLDGKEERIRSVYRGTNGKLYKPEIYNKTQGDVTETIKQQRQMAMAYGQQKTSAYEWVGGYDSYFSGGHPENNPNWHGPSKGTLTIDATGSVTKISYSSASEGLKQKSMPISKSIQQGNKGFKAFFLKADPSIEGSEKAVNTINNYVTVVTIPFAAPEVLAGKALPIISTMSSLDDVLGGENGSLSTQYLGPKLNSLVNAVKVGVGLVGRTADVMTLAKESDDVFKTIKNTGLVIKDTYDVTKGAIETGNSIKEGTSAKEKQKD